MLKFTTAACLLTLLFATTANASYRVICKGENPNFESIVTIDGTKVSVDVSENGVTAEPLNRPCKKRSTGLLCVSVKGETRYELFPTFLISEVSEVAIVRHDRHTISSTILDDCEYIDEEDEE